MKLINKKTIFIEEKEVIPKIHSNKHMFLRIFLKSLIFLKIHHFFYL